MPLLSMLLFGGSMDKAYRIGITGASGLIGSALTSFLEKKGYRVIPISLRRSLNLDTLESMDAVVNLAGENIGSGRWNRQKKEKIFNSRVQGTKRLVSALNQLNNPPKVLVSSSAIGYYGNHSKGECIESSPAGSDFLATVCKDWEAEALKFKGRCVTPRFATVITSKGGALSKLLPLFKLGLGGEIGGGKQSMSWIALNDLIKILFILISDPSFSGAVNVTTNTPITNAEFTRVLGSILHRPTWLHIPTFLMKWILGEMAEATLLASLKAKPKVLLDYGFKFHFSDIIKALEQ